MKLTQLLKTLVETESPSHDKAAVDRAAAIGEGYHSEREYIFAGSMEQKENLIAELIREW